MLQDLPGLHYLDDDALENDFALVEQFVELVVLLFANGGHLRE